MVVFGSVPNLGTSAVIDGLSFSSFDGTTILDLDARSRFPRCIVTAQSIDHESTKTGSRQSMETWKYVPNYSS